MARLTRRAAAAREAQEATVETSQAPKAPGTPEKHVPREPEISFATNTESEFDKENDNEHDETIQSEVDPKKIQVLGLEPVDHQILPPPVTPHKPLADITQDNLNQVVNTLQNVKLDSATKPDLSAAAAYPDTPVATNRSPSGRTSLVSSPSKLQQMPELPPPPKQRLVITQLVLNNFKSYAGRQVIGPFHSVCFSPLFLCYKLGFAPLCYTSV